MVPAERLVEPQGELGLLAPDEEVFLKHYCSLSAPLRAVIALLAAKAAGAEKEQAEERGVRDAAKPQETRQPRLRVLARRPE